MSKQTEKPQPGSVKPWKWQPIQFSEKALAAAIKKEEARRAYEASLNPKGVPIIFPGYD